MKNTKKNSMRPAFILRIIIITCIVLLCAGYGLYSFFRLTETEGREEVDLYELVPQSAIGVFETDNVSNLIKDLTALNCSQENHFLYFSELFADLKKNFYHLTDDMPHGLSNQMNQMLMSFHSPDNKMNQVLYCKLSSDDVNLLERLMAKYLIAPFSTKTSSYKGEEILIYPMSNGNFLACFYTDDFLVLSYQKRLIEEVIDAYHNGHSLQKDKHFATLHDAKSKTKSSTLYLRMKSTPMGRQTDSIQNEALLGGWSELDLQLGDNRIYLSGVNHPVEDDALTFMETMSMQKPIDSIPNRQLPASTFFFYQMASTDWSLLNKFTAQQKFVGNISSDREQQMTNRLFRYLQTYAISSVTSCLFYKDTLRVKPSALLIIPLQQSDEAWKEFKDRFHPRFKGRYGILPTHTLLTQMTGLSQSGGESYIHLFRGNLLIAPNEESLSSYIQFIEKEELLDTVSGYQACQESLLQNYNFLMMTNLGDIMNLSENYVRLIPGFFFRHQDFFSHFIFSMQLVCSDGVTYPNFVLLYKGEK